jgi:transcriptional regulator with XRE-family HTH domain
MSSISSVLKIRRKELGLTLAQIAEQIGVTEATVQRWESGNIKSLRHERITKLAEILGVSPAVLMGWEEVISENSKNKDFSLRNKITETYGETVCEMIDKFLRLDNIDRAKIIERTDMLLEDKKYSIKE